MFEIADILRREWGGRGEERGEERRGEGKEREERSGGEGREERRGGEERGERKGEERLKPCLFYLLESRIEGRGRRNTGVML